MHHLPLFRSSKIFAFLITLSAAQAAQAYSLIAPYTPPTISPPSGWVCSSEYQPNSSADISWFTPIHLAAGVGGVAQFSLSEVTNYTGFDYSAPVMAVASAVSVAANNLGVNTSVRGWPRDFVNSRDGSTQLTDANYYTNLNSGVNGGSDPIANGLCNATLFENTCKGTSAIPLGNDSACYASGFMPSLDANDMAGKMLAGVVAVLWTNVETWDGRAWTYGLDHYYVIYGVEWVFGAPEFLLYDPTDLSRHAVILENENLPIRWSNGGVTSKHPTTVVESTLTTATSTEIVIGYYGLDTIVNDFR